MVVPLGLRARILLPPSIPKLGVQPTDHRAQHASGLDVFEQIYQIDGSLHTISSRLSPVTGVHHLRLLTRPN